MVYVTEEAAQLRADQEEARSGTAGEDIGAAAGAEVAVAQWWWAAPVTGAARRGSGGLGTGGGGGLPSPTAAGGGHGDGRRRQICTATGWARCSRPRAMGAAPSHPAGAQGAVSWRHARGRQTTPARGSQCEGVQARLAARLAPRRLLSSGGKVLGEEEKAAENIYIKVEITCRGRQLLPILTLQHCC
uniref:Uncharacterized protein n=1 Tax=Oryza rufipogon TaxID=4529 RepID=A0A0E0R969_ORYRU